jgi:hypothetical protein
VGVGVALSAFNWDPSQLFLLPCPWGTRFRDPSFMRPCVLLLRLSWEPTQRSPHRCGDGTQQQHVERAAREASAGLCIGQCPNYSVRALLGAEPGARGATPFGSPDASFTVSRRRYPCVGCHYDRMERTVLVRRKLDRGVQSQFDNSVIIITSPTADDLRLTIGLVLWAAQ